MGIDPVELPTGDGGPLRFTAASPERRGERAEVVELFVGRVGGRLDVRPEVHERLLRLRERDAVELGEDAAQLDARSPGQPRHALLEQGCPLERPPESGEQRVEPVQDRFAIARERERCLIGEDRSARSGEGAFEGSARSSRRAGIARLGMEQALFVEGAQCRFEASGRAMQRSQPGP